MNENVKKSTAKTLGELLKNEIKENPKFYLFSPDETTSNKLDATYDVASRAWSNLEIKPQDLKEADGGRIVELLSENVLFSVMLGHLLKHEPAMMTSYESFFTIIASQIVPVDSKSIRVVYDFMLKSENVVNLTTFNKTEEPQYLDDLHAEYQLNFGASIFGFASDGDTFNLESETNHFDFIFTAAGDIATREALAAMALVRAELPEIKLRFINILSLTHNYIGTTEHQMTPEIFDKLFTVHTPIIANFHGYKDTLKNILRNYTTTKIFAHGFEEKGSTTTPLQMLTLNHASRFDLAIDVFNQFNRQDLVLKYQRLIDENRAYAQIHGIDSIEL